MNNNILVSVIIPFYANIQWLDEAIQSVYNQTYKNIEIIVIIDGSKENIINIKKKYTKKITFISQENKGVAIARNNGMELAKGDYIAFLDSDDLWVKNKVFKQLTFMIKNNYLWSHTDYLRFKNLTNKFIYMKCNLSGKIIPKCFISNPIATPCVMIKRDILIQNKLLRFQSGKKTGEDIFLWQELGKIYSLGYLNESLTKVRIHGNNFAFQARHQLKFRGDSLAYMQTNKNLFKSKFIYFYYIILLYYCQITYKIINKISNRFRFNDKYFEITCKLIYTIPYLGFKLINKFI